VALRLGTKSMMLDKARFGEEKAKNKKVIRHPLTFLAPL
jgi:hypothetical protein